MLDMSRTAAVLQVEAIVRRPEQQGEECFTDGFSPLKASDLNTGLLQTLTEKGVTDVFLFSDIITSDDEHTKRTQLVALLRLGGFRVHAVITPSDIGWGKIYSPSIKALTDYFAKNPDYYNLAQIVNRSTHLGPQTEEKRLRQALQELYETKAIDDYTLGQAYADACVDDSEQLKKSSRFTHYFYRLYCQMRTLDNDTAINKRDFTSLVIQMLIKKHTYSWIKEIIFVHQLNKFENIKKTGVPDGYKVTIHAVGVSNENWDNKEEYRTRLNFINNYWSFSIKASLATTTTLVEILGLILLTVGAASLLINFGLLTAVPAVVVGFPALMIGVGALALGTTVVAAPVLATATYQSINFFYNKYCNEPGQPKPLTHIDRTTVHQPC